MREIVGLVVVAGRDEHPIAGLRGIDCGLNRRVLARATAVSANQEDVSFPARDASGGLQRKRAHQRYDRRAARAP